MHLIERWLFNPPPYVVLHTKHRAISHDLGIVREHFLQRDSKYTQLEGTDDIIQRLRRQNALVAESVAVRLLTSAHWIPQSDLPTYFGPHYTPRSIIQIQRFIDSHFQLLLPNEELIYDQIFQPPPATANMGRVIDIYPYRRKKQKDSSGWNSPVNY